MGFSHAFDLAHSAHEHILSQSVPDARLLQDRAPAPKILPDKPAVLIYADNAGHLSSCKATTDSSRERLSAALNSRGLSTHEVEDGVVRGELLGVRFDGFIGTISSTPERDSLLDQSLLAVIEGAAITSDEMRRIVGHLTIRLLLRRPMLSLLYHVYKFIGKEIKARVPAWSSVKLELRVLRGLLVFALSDLRVRPNPVVTMTDACLSGYGVGESTWDVSDVSRVAGRDER